MNDDTCPTCDRDLIEQPSMADTSGHTVPCAPCAAGNGLATLYRRGMPEGQEWIPMIKGTFPDAPTIRGYTYTLESADRHRATYRRD